MVFYPDNAARATRLQQLVDSMSNMQGDIMREADEMNQKNKDIHGHINTLLKAKKIDSVNDLIDKSKAKMTPDEKLKFEKLIEAAKKSKAGFDYTYFLAGLLMLPEGAILTAHGIASVGRFVVRLSAIQAMAGFFKSSTSSASVAAQAARELEKVAVEAENAAKKAGTAGEAGIEVKEAAGLMSKVGTALKVIGAIGFVVTLISGIIEVVEGAEQKEKLIEAIHGCQPARLCIAFFKEEARNVTEQLGLMQVYLEHLAGPKKDKDVAASLGKEIVDNIKAENSAIAWNKLEKQYEAQDKTAGNYYGADDLPTDQVVAKAKAST